jgi:hypothetical protein
MACQARYADYNDFATKYCESFDEEDESEVNRSLELAATNINMAIAAQGACDCTFSSWSAQYLIELNCIIALVTFNCRCSTIRALAAEDRAVWADWANNQLTLIREGKIELCDGETGSDFPVTSWADQGTTEFARTRIIVNDVLRNRETS